MFQSFKYGIGLAMFLLFFLFVLLNLITGCSDWEETNCVTPTQFLSILTGGFIR